MSPIYARPKIRGGVTALAGWALTLIGVVDAFVAWGILDQSVLGTLSTGVPLTAFDPFLAAGLWGLCTGIAGGGVLLIGFARGERDREEDLRLEPFRYSPFRHPWKRVLPWLVVVIAALVIPSLWIAPIPHAFSYEFPVSNCTSGSPGTTFTATIPSGAVLAYHWSSSNGQPVGEVWAPDGAQVTADSSNWGLTSAFFNSSYGNSALVGNGSAISFWACDFPPSPARNQIIELSGTYYATVLSI